MSMELYVLSNTKLASIEVWQRAIDAEGLSLTLSASRPFADLRGALPVQLNGKQTAFECDHWDRGDLIETYTDIDFGSKWKYTLAFRWGADIHAGVAVYMAAASYAKATRGAVFDCEEGKIISPDRAREVALKMESEIPLFEAAMKKRLEKFEK